MWNFYIWTLKWISINANAFWSKYQSCSRAFKKHFLFNQFYSPTTITLKRHFFQKRVRKVPKKCHILFEWPPFKVKRLGYRKHRGCEIVNFKFAKQNNALFSFDTSRLKKQAFDSHAVSLEFSRWPSLCRIVVDLPFCRSTLFLLLFLQFTSVLRRYHDCRRSRTSGFPRIRSNFVWNQKGIVGKTFESSFN